MNLSTTLGLGKPLAAAATSTHGAPNGQRFLHHLHRMRAIAIACIVAIHVTYLFDWSASPRLESFFNDLFDNSTLLFVFISGFLFQHLNRDRFDYGHYLLTKLRNVVLPYLVAATPAIVLALWAGGVAQRYPELSGHSRLYEFGWFLVNAGAHLNYALWFMPVIFLFYLAAPVLRLIIQQPRWYGSLLLLIPLSIAMHRPTYEHGHDLALALYFLPVYLSGMCLSQYRKRADIFLDRYFVAIVAVFVGVFIAHYLLSSHHGKYTVSDLLMQRESLIDWLFIQKFLLCFALYAGMRKLNGYRLPTLDLLGATSFTIYFVHMYILTAFRHFTHYQPLPGHVVSLIALLLITLISGCLIALGTRALFGRYSRCVLGS